MKHPNKEKYFGVLLNVPKAWMPLIDEAAEKAGMNRNEWLRTIIRDVLIGEGVWPSNESTKGN